MRLRPPRYWRETRDRAVIWLVFLIVLVGMPLFCLASSMGGGYLIAVEFLGSAGLLLLGCLTVASLVASGQEDQRRFRGACLSCGYNLTGNVSGICPECGTKIEKA